jgi:amino acid adenylation domain-containing protein
MTVHTGQPSTDVLSSAQERLWFLDQLAGGRCDYQAVRSFELTGPVDADVLESAVRYVAERHDVLRTRVVLRDGEPVPVVDPPETVSLERIDVRGAPDPVARGALLLAEHATRACDLAAGPLLRPVLVRIAEQVFRFQYTVHHIAFDGPSRVIFERELGLVHAALIEDREPDLVPVTSRYADHAAHQRAEVARGALAGQERYWVERMRDVTELSWPPARTGVAEPRRPVGRAFTIGAEACARLRELARTERTSLFVVLLAAYQYLLGRMGATDDVPVGIPFAGRADPELENAIGFFTNTVVLRGDLTGAPSMRELLCRTRDDVLDALDHQDIPFERVVDALRVGRDSGRNPLFQHWFGFLDGELAGDGLCLGAVGCVPVELPPIAVRFDTELEIVVRDGGLAGTLVHPEELLDARTAERLVDRYRRLLDWVSWRPDTPLSAFRLVDEAEHRELLALGTGPALDPPPRTVGAWFADQAARTPDEVAVADVTGSLTYRRLADAADSLAGRLHRVGVARGSVVAVQLPRGVDMVVAWLAVVRCGAAYLPVDADVPADRVGYLVDDGAVAAVLTHEAAAPRLRTVATRCPVLAVDAPAAPEAPAPPPARSGVDDPLYVIYTSGSTGRPKGVVVSHRQFAGLVRWHLDTYGQRPGDRVAQLASSSFDAATWDVWAALLSGATVVICPEAVVRDPVELAGWLAANGISSAFAVSPLAEQLLREPLGERTPMRQLLTGADAFRPPEHDDPGIPVVNHYGPTETAVVATASPPLRAPWADNSIGRPLPGVRVYLVDPDMRLVPRDVVGELCVGGASVAHGYRGRSALTAERFVPDPFGAVPGARMYRTGDLARWRADGTLHYVRRVDAQVKVRGYRIEPGEVEAALLAHPAVRAAAVAAQPGRSGQPVLVGYVVPDDAAPRADRLRADLGRVLPHYLVPQAFVVLTELPMTVSGKIDRARLPHPDLPPGEHVPPRTPVEEVMGRLWQDVLGTDRVGAHDDFFALGGNSMAAARLLARIRSTFEVDFPMRGIFDHRSLAELCVALEELVRAEIAAMSPEQIAAELGS